MASLCIASKFPQGMIAFLCAIHAAHITKPELRYRQVVLVGQQTVVLPPHFIIHVTVAAEPGFSACVIHPACALLASRRSSAPVPHRSAITRDKPASATAIYSRTKTLVLDELLAVARHVRQTRQLGQARPLVLHVKRVAAWWFTPVYQGSGFTVVTDYCHADTVFVTHVTQHREWSQASWTVGVDDVTSVGCSWVSILYVTARQ